MNRSYYLRLMVLFTILPVFHLWAQNGTISGAIKDAVTGEGLIGAQVYVPAMSTGAVADIDGNYSLELPTGTYTLQVLFVGYKTIEQEVTLNAGSQTLNFELEEDILGLDAVVITATFAERSLFNSPQSVSRLDAAALGNLTANSQADILRTVPGIHAEGGGGEVASNIFVRGLPSGGQYQFTPLQVDGLPVLSAFGLNSSAHDVYFRNDIGIQNLEFVRGGVSTLFGAGSVAGIINYTSVTGSLTPENKVVMEWASGGRARTEFLSAGPINERTFYAISGFYRYDAGPLETGLLTEGVQIRGNLKRVSEDGNGTFKISGQYIDDHVQFYLPYPLQNNDGVYTRPTGNDGQEVFTMLTGAATEFSFDTPNGVFETPIENGVATKGGYLMMDLQRSFGNDWSLSAKAKYADYDHQFNLFLDGDGTHNVPETQAGYLTDRNLPGGDSATFVYVDNGEELADDDLLFENRVLDRARPMREMVAEINLSKEIGRHNITVGTFNSYTLAEDNNWIWNYLGDFSNSPRMVGLSYVDATSGETLNYSTGGFIRGAQTSNRQHAMRKTAFYLADQFVANNFSLDVGGRFETARGYITRETGVGTNTFQKGEVSASDFTVALAALYKLNSNTNLYLNASRGYFFPEIRSVAFSSPGETQSYETENILQAEGGVKYGAGNFSGNAAAYFVALQDRRTVDFVNDGSGGVTEMVEFQSTRTIGVEANVNYFILPVLNVSGNLTYQQHQLTKNETEPELVGNWLRRQPRIMGMVALNFKNDRFDASISDNFIGRKFANTSNTVELEGYGIVRLDGGYTLNLGDEETLRLGVSVFNLLNADGVTEGSPRQGNAQIQGGEFFVGRPILPRRVFIRAAFNF
ncbi:MAG: TonB-dependent receptor [Bacteroidota bacterium]